MPNKAAIRKWVEMLETTDLPQATGQLGRVGDTSSYCCLGIACLAFKEEDDSLPMDWAGETSEIAFGKELNVGTLPTEVIDWLGFSYFPHSADPVLFSDEDGEDITCSDANDNYGWSFKEIAKALHKRYLGEES
jgi:hypothetical protein